MGRILADLPHFCGDSFPVKFLVDVFFRIGIDGDLPAEILRRLDGI